MRLGHEIIVTKVHSTKLAIIILQYNKYKWNNKILFYYRLDLADNSHFARYRRSEDNLMATISWAW